MGFEDSDSVKDGDGAGDGKVSVVTCSICFDDVCNNGERAWAKLVCGHLFHLDCIGSAFNTKGAMQCPNCRSIEKGQWLCAGDSRSSISSEFNVYDEDLYDLGYNDRSFGAHWYQFTGLARHSSSINAGEISSAPYHDLFGQHARFAEQTSVSSPPRPCPYVAYLEPYQHPSSNSTRNVPESSHLNSHWNGPPAEMSTSYAFPATTDDLEYYSWQQHFTVTPMPPVTQSSRRATAAGVQRSGSVMHSFHVGHSAGVRAMGAVASSAPPPNAGSNARTRDRSQARHGYHQHLSPNNAPAAIHTHTPMVSHSRRSQPRSVSQPSNQAGGFYFYPSGQNHRHIDVSLASHYHSWESEHLPSFPYQQLSGGSDSGVRLNSYYQQE